MANLAQIDFKGRGQEARTRALLDDLVTENYRGHGTPSPLALAVWYAKSHDRPDQFLLLLFSGMPIDGIVPVHVPLHWKSGAPGPPFVNIDTMNVAWYLKLRLGDPRRLDQYHTKNEVLYFDKRLLTPEIMDQFGIKVEPPGLIKGWYVSESEYAKSKPIRGLLSLYGQAKPMVGVVKTTESADFENCRAIPHVEVGQKWLPFTPEGIQSYTYYNDQQAGRDVYFLFEGGSLYQVLKFEVRTAPDYATKFGLLGSVPNDRYPEVYLRAVHQPAKPAA